MKAAVLISGYSRSFIENIPIIQKKVIENFKHADIYIHITKNEISNDKYLNLYSNNLDTIIKSLDPKIIIFEDNLDLKKNENLNNLFNTWLKFKKLNEIKKINEKLSGKYDIVIKIRPDMAILSDNIFENISINSDSIFIPKKSLVDKSKLLNNNDRYICDIFAFGSSTMMDKYFEIYDNLNQLTSSYGYVPETILYNYLKNSKVKYTLLNIDYNMILSMCNVFAISGDSGSGKSTLGKILKPYFSNSFIMECDRYHKWERNDDNWKKFTHLNPEANYLSKMEEDLFNLKIGNDIYQVDYDHKNGKFTEKKKIKSSDNLIVCGLHSLYSKNNSIYNLKIFMDTDETLKKNWKIKRDIEKRGYTKEKVLSQIIQRENDYLRYVDIQKENSDVIIKFFTKEKFDIENIDKKIKTSLSINIKNRFNLKSLLNEFDIQNINYKIDKRNTHTEVIFEEYKYFLFSDIQHNDFYDYIAFIILNLK